LAPILLLICALVEAITYWVSCRHQRFVDGRYLSLRQLHLVGNIGIAFYTAALIIIGIIRTDAANMCSWFLLWLPLFSTYILMDTGACDAIIWTLVSILSNIALYLYGYYTGTLFITDLALITLSVSI
jgi:hypothetical protein